MINRRRPKDEPRDIGSDLLPTIVLYNLAFFALAGSLGIMVGSLLLWQQQIGVGNTRRPNLKGLAKELVLSVDFSVVMPQRRLRPASGDWRVVADLLRDISVFAVQSNVFKGFALKRDIRAQFGVKTMPRQRTSIGLNGLAIRPRVDE